MTLAADTRLLHGFPRDHAVASPARIRDAALHGHDNYAADRAALHDLNKAAPGFTDLLRAVRAWHVRVVRHLATRGIDQFLDLAAGLPTPQDNTHLVAQRQNPDAKVVYTDTDSLVSSYQRALLCTNDDVHVAQADHFDPHAVFAHETVLAALDLSRPIAVLLTSGIQDEPDDDRVAAALNGYHALLPPGSALALTCWSPTAESGDASSQVDALQRTWQARCARTVRSRTESGVRRLFARYDLLDPGLARVTDWWPDGPMLRTPPPAHRFAVGGVGIKR